MRSLRYLVRAAEVWLQQQRREGLEPEEAQFIVDMAKAYRVALHEDRRNR